MPEDATVDVEIPDGFDLDAARAAGSTTDDEDHPHCPECGRRTATRKTGKPFGDAVRVDGDWRCDHQDCGAHFDDPVWGGDGA